MRTVSLAALGGCLFFLVGCGGGGGGGGGSVATTPLRFDMQWGERSRAVTAPSSALSAVISIPQGSANGSDFTWTVNREAAPAAYTASFTSPNQAKVGPANVTIRLYALPGGTGDVVGIGAANVTINPDGTGIGSIATNGTIASVAVVPGQTVAVAEVKELAFTTRNTEGTLITVSPGSAKLQLVSGGQRLQVNSQGMAVGVRPGTATVATKLDGITSPNQDVTVTSNAVVTINPANASLLAGSTKIFSAEVTNTGDNSVTWAVQEGPAGGTITADGLYTAPANGGTFHVIATSNYDPAKSASAVVQVTKPNVTITIAPENATVAINGTQTFTATVAGAANTGVAWSVDEGATGGAVTVAGLYTAPAVAGTYHVTATSLADPTRKATATVNVSANIGGSTVIIK